MWGLFYPTAAPLRPPGGLVLVITVLCVMKKNVDFAQNLSLGDLIIYSGGFKKGVIKVKISVSRIDIGKFEFTSSLFEMSIFKDSHLTLYFFMYLRVKPVQWWAAPHQLCAASSPCFARG